jgi:type IX secretion system PorP/SprF family membrane protein
MWKLPDSTLAPFFAAYVILAGITPAHAQQSAIFSQYIFNLFAINPAYAGARETLSANVGYRAQWLAVPGSPRTLNFNVHTPLLAHNMAIGLLVQADETGARSAPKVAAAYAYSVQLSAREKLRFGVQGGVMNYQIHWNRLEYADPFEPVASGAPPSRWMPTADAGIMYTAPRGYAGLSYYAVGNHTKARSVAFDERVENALTFAAGRVWTLSEQVDLKPGTLVRYTTNGLWQADVSLSALLLNRVWITGIYRSGFGAVSAVHTFVTDKLQVGYSYDWAAGRTATFGQATHEVYLGIDLSRNAANAPTRYF